jgi:hypothetical protein
MSTETLNYISAVLLTPTVVAGSSRLKYLIDSPESKFILIRCTFKAGYSAVLTRLGDIRALNKSAYEKNADYTCLVALVSFVVGCSTPHVS